MSASAPSVAGAVTALFVPGDRPERFAKALASGADAVILDLEDAVAPEARATAADAVEHRLREPWSDGARLLVRLPTAEDTELLLRLLAVDSPAHPGFVLPKAESPTALARTIALAPAGTEFVALIETAAGVLAAPDLARVPGVTRLAFGAVDFALDVDARATAVRDHARSALVLASRAAGLAAPLDSPSLDIADLAVVEAGARDARDFGFGGKLVIHPAQLPAVRSGFRPDAEELAWAHRVAAASGGAVQLDGMMIDRPVVERAERLLRQERAATGGAR